MREAEIGRHSRRMLGLGMIVVMAGALLWWQFGRSDPPSVRVERVVSGPAAEILAVNGQLRPGRTDRIGAPVLGQVVAVMVEEGDEVAKGQLLLRLDDTIARQAVIQAEATLAAARVDAEAKQRAWERARALTDTISAQARENAEFAWRAAQANVAQLEAALAQARQQLDLYQVTSPSDGTVLSVEAKIGQVVGSSSVLVTVGNLRQPRVEADVDEVFGVRLRPGLKASVAPVGSDDAIPAHVEFVAPTVDPLTGGRLVRLRLDDEPEVPMPSGLTMSVNIVVEQFEDVIAIPGSAILDLDRAPRVMIVENGQASERSVTVRNWPSDRLIVSEGLAEGDLLILAPQDVQPGQRVIAVE